MNLMTNLSKAFYSIGTSSNITSNTKDLRSKVFKGCSIPRIGNFVFHNLKDTGDRVATKRGGECREYANRCRLRGYICI